MAWSSAGADSTPQLPEYAPVPEAAIGPALNEQGYFVGRVERNLFWVTNGTYRSAFLATPDGVVLFDAPPDNIYIHFPDHDALMLVDIVNPGWVPIYNLNLSEDVPGYIGAPDQALAHPWTHYIGGHLGRLGTRDDLVLHQQYIADIVDSSHAAVLTAADASAFTTRTTFSILQSIRLDLGTGSQVHP